MGHAWSVAAPMSRSRAAAAKPTPPLNPAPMHRVIQHDFATLAVSRPLMVGAPHGAPEAAADQAADAIVRGQRASPSARALPPDSALERPMPPAESRELASRMGQGVPLPAAARALVSRSLGVEAGDVRVHDDEAADGFRRQLRARAFSIGRHVFLPPGGGRPTTVEGLWTLGHEVAHALQPSGDQLVLRMTPDDPSERARYPTPTERAGVREIVNPQHSAAPAGGNVPPVDDENAFRAEMGARLGPYIDRALTPALERRASSISIGLPEITALGNVARSGVETTYSSYLRAAVHTPAEAARRSADRLVDHLHVLPTTASAETSHVASEWLASRMEQQGGDIIEAHNVLAGRNGRDRALFESVRDSILAQRMSDLQTIVLFHPGYEGGGEAYIQGRLRPAAGDTEQVTRRRGRWAALATTVHEMLHLVAHERFTDTAHLVERQNVLEEGFAEYFARPVYDQLVRRAAAEQPLRASIEGGSAPFDPLLARPEHRGYQEYVDRVMEIRELLGASDENLKVAFFMGRVEYLGLGGWNEAEAGRRRFPGNTLGLGALLTTDGGGLFRVDYGRILAGRSGALQLSLGGTFTYLTEGSRLGLLGTGSLQYSWPNVYVRGNVGVGASAGVGQPFSSSIRFDLLPGVEAGVRIGVVRIGANGTLLVPVAGGPVAERTAKFALGIGLSMDL